MPLDGGPWEAVRKQKEMAVERAVDEPADFWTSDLVGGYSDDLFEAAGGHGVDREIPLSYHTKASAWATDYPLIYRRVMAYFNPGAMAAADSFEAYVLREFGCHPETLAELIADAWFVPLLDERSAYDPDAAAAIGDLFDAVDPDRYEVEPRFVNLVDWGLGAAVATRPELGEKYERAPGGDRADIDATVEAWTDPDHPYDGGDTWHRWHDLPTDSIDDLYGVIDHDDLREYVVERAVKLELVDDAVGTFTDGDDRIGNIRTLARQYVEASGTHARESLRRDLVEATYLNWNQFGTPAYYCDFSGTVDIGPEPLRDSWLGQLRAWFRRLYRRAEDALARLADRLPVDTSRLNLSSVETNTVSSRDIALRSVDGVAMDDLFAVGPGRASHDDWVDTVTTRADAYDRYYDRLFAGGDGLVHDDVLGGGSDGYGEFVRNHNAVAESDTLVKKVCSDVSNAVVIGDMVNSIQGLGPHLDTFGDAVLGAAELAEPTPLSVLCGVGQAALEVPEYLATSGETMTASITQRGDVTYGDVWGFPYGTRARLMSQVQFVTREALFETFSLPDVPLVSG